MSEKMEITNNNTLVGYQLAMSRQVLDQIGGVLYIMSAQNEVDTAQNSILGAENYVEALSVAALKQKSSEQLAELEKLSRKHEIETAYGNIIYAARNAGERWKCAGFPDMNTETYVVEQETRSKTVRTPMPSIKLPILIQKVELQKYEDAKSIKNRLWLKTSGHIELYLCPDNTLAYHNLRDEEGLLRKFIANPEFVDEQYYELEFVAQLDEWGNRKRFSECNYKIGDMGVVDKVLVVPFKDNPIVIKIKSCDMLAHYSDECFAHDGCDNCKRTERKVNTNRSFDGCIAVDDLIKLLDNICPEIELPDDWDKVEIPEKSFS